MIIKITAVGAREETADYLKKIILLYYIYSIYKRLIRTVKGAIFISIVPNPK
nr:MAG TPA: hypothetical protein [Caudoviricetes sp.]